MTDKSVRNMMWAPEAWELRPSTGSYGKWALRIGEATIRFFRYKRDAETFTRHASIAGKIIANNVVKIRPHGSKARAAALVSLTRGNFA